MSLSFDVYVDRQHQPCAELNDANPQRPFAVIRFGEHPATAQIVLRTYEDADALMRAAVTARELLAGAEDSRDTPSRTVMGVVNSRD